MLTDRQELAARFAEAIIAKLPKEDIYEVTYEGLTEEQIKKKTEEFIKMIKEGKCWIYAHNEKVNVNFLGGVQGLADKAIELADCILRCEL